MQTGSRSRNGAFVFGKDALKLFHVFRFGLAAYKPWQRSLAQSVELALEFVVVAVVKEAQRAAAACRVVNNFGYNGVSLAEIELVADADFSCRVNQHVPQAQFLIKFAQEEHFNAGTGFFLVAVKAGGKYFGIIKDKQVVLVKIVQDFLEHLVLDFTCFAV